MDLEMYIHTRNFEKSEFAKMLNVSKQALSNYCKKRREPCLAITQRIIELTKGKVGIKDLIIKRQKRWVDHG